MLQRRVPVPPFTLESATEKVQKAEDAWNSRDADRCAAAYTEDSVWGRLRKRIAKYVKAPACGHSGLNLP